MAYGTETIQFQPKTIAVGNLLSIQSFLRASSALFLQEQVRMPVETICVVLPESGSTKTSK